MECPYCRKADAALNNSLALAVYESDIMHKGTVYHSVMVEFGGCASRCQELINIIASYMENTLGIKPTLDNRQSTPEQVQ